MGVAGSKLEKALGDQFPEGERYFALENLGNTCYCNSVLQGRKRFGESQVQLPDFVTQSCDVSGTLRDGVRHELGIDLKKVEKCMGDPNADFDNPVLKKEQDAQIGKGSRGDVTILPTLIVNDRQYRGKLEKGSVLKAICSGFEETTEPADCLSGDVETNECINNNGGYWQD